MKVYYITYASIRRLINIMVMANMDFFLNFDISTVPLIQVSPHDQING
jgi:hypothetical protein